MRFPVWNQQPEVRTRTTPGQGLKVSDFIDPGPTPGNVGVCLSGGGSRAMTAGMGQLRALAHLQLNGQSLLAQTRALSTVSGGSWIGQTFCYQQQASVDAYLNSYVDDPHRLIPTKTPEHSDAETLDCLPKGNPGRNIDTLLFSPVGLAVSALLLKVFFKVPPNMLWQTLVGDHLLRPYKLYRPVRHKAPDSLFSFDRTVLQRDVLDLNSDLDAETAHLVARLPFPICNQSLFITQSAPGPKLLAPVQSTPFITGVMGSPAGTDANGKTAGGGGVTSFAFNSVPTDIDAGVVQADQDRQWALTDSIGTSSAFFAEALTNLFADWRDNEDDFYAKLDSVLEAQLEWLRGMTDDLDQVLGFLLRKLIDGLEAASQKNHAERRQHLRELFEGIGLGSTRLHRVFGDLAIQGLVPEYDYWPVKDPSPVAEFQPTRFGDGGNLDNTGIAGLLVYQDIDRVIAFNNTSDAMTAADLGAYDAQGNEIPNTRVYIGSNIPPLFGYQPYQAGNGYRLYADDSDPGKPEFAHSQLFPAEDFAALLQGLWQNSGNHNQPGSNQHPAVFRQTLDLQSNPWFGIAGGRPIDVLWVYNNPVRDWYQQLNSSVKKLLGDFDDPDAFHGFPNYPTINTNLDATEINLLASLSAWVVAGADGGTNTLSMYQD